MVDGWCNGCWKYTIVFKLKHWIPHASKSFNLLVKFRLPRGYSKYPVDVQDV